jgi:uncharacterized protein YkwD
MAADGYFDHASHDGTSFAKRLEHFYPSSGYRRWMVGETLLWSSPDVDAAAAVEDWLASPPHRRILLTPSWRQIGISAVHETSAPGVYGGLEVTIITADFGVRSH